MSLHKAKISMKSEIGYGVNTFISTQPRLKIRDGWLEGSDLTQGKILRTIAKNREYIPNQTQVEMASLLQIEEDEWKKAWKNVKGQFESNRAKEFLFTLLSGVTYTNRAYVRMGRKKSSKCTFCEEPKQDFIHAFLQCSRVTKLRENISRNWQGESMPGKRWVLGSSLYSEPLEQAKDFIARQLNHHIFKSNWAETEINEVAFTNMVLSQEEVELALAARLGRSYDIQLKWEYVKILLT